MDNGFSASVGNVWPRESVISQRSDGHASSSILGFFPNSHHRRRPALNDMSNEPVIIEEINEVRPYPLFLSTYSVFIVGAIRREWRGISPPVVVVDKLSVMPLVSISTLFKLIIDHNYPGRPQIAATRTREDIHQGHLIR